VIPRFVLLTSLNLLKDAVIAAVRDCGSPAEALVCAKRLGAVTIRHITTAGRSILIALGLGSMSLTTPRLRLVEPAANY